MKTLEKIKIKPWYQSKTLIAILITTITAISPLVTNAADKGKLEAKDVIAILSAGSLAALGAYSRGLPNNLSTPSGVPTGIDPSDNGANLVRSIEQ